MPRRIQRCTSNDVSVSFYVNFFINDDTVSPFGERLGQV